MAAGPHSSYRWQKKRAQVIADSDGICSWCGKPVDLTLSGNHPWGPVVDHGLELTEGGDLLDNRLTLMHRKHNEDKEIERRKRRRELNPSRRW